MAAARAKKAVEPAPVEASVARETIRMTGMAATMAILDTFNTAGVVVPTGAPQ